ncbi:MAG: hypothetical protein PHX86_08520 [Caldisericia bacterium]|nr:hypothetical protein [Caldisericia bacterium]
MFKRILRYFRLLLFYDLNATTYEEFDVRSYVARKSRGNIQLMHGHYITQKEYDKERERFLNFDYTKVIKELDSRQKKGTHKS